MHFIITTIPFSMVAAAIHGKVYAKYQLSHMAFLFLKFNEFNFKIPSIIQLIIQKQAALQVRPVSI